MISLSDKKQEQKINSFERNGQSPTKRNYSYVAEEFDPVQPKIKIFERGTIWEGGRQ